jgi:hypothetical protein
MLEAKPAHLIGDRAYDSDGLDDELTQDGVNMIAPLVPPGSSRRSMDGTYAAMNAGGSWNASLPGSNGNDASSFVGSTTPPISSDLCSSPASPCSSNNLEIGSNQKSALDAPTPQILWRAEVGSQPIDIKAGDITGDGRPDIVIAYSVGNTPGSSIVAIDNTGQILWRFDTETQAAIWNVSIGDIDGDGVNDVAGYESQLPSFLYAIKSDGTLLWKYQLPKTGTGIESSDHVKIADVTGDGRNEVIVGAPGASAVYIFNKDGVVLQSYSVPAAGVAAIPFIDVADLSGDGINDLLISYGYQCPPCGLRVMDSSGNLLWDFPSAVRLGHAAVGDINNDGNPEVIASENAGNKIFAISHSGNLLWSVPLQGNTSTVAVGNLNEQGLPHILAGSGTRVNLINANGKLVWALDANANVYKVLFGEYTGGGGKKEIVAATITGNIGTEIGGFFL